jgi:hypothetical protein
VELMTTIRGIAYPLAVDATSGNLAIATDADLIATHILSMIETEPKENPMRPRYGTPGLLFESEQNFDEYVADVRRRLIREIPQAKFETSGTLGDEGEALINIFWTYQGTEQETITVELG